MEDNSEKKKLPRRAFLETGLTASVGIVLGSAACSLLDSSDTEAPEMVKMLTADGKLVEVEKRHLPKMCGKPVAVSNQELKDWMATERKNKFPNGG